MLVVDSEAAAQVDALHGVSGPLEAVGQIHSAFAGEGEDVHVGDLGAHVHVQPLELYVLERGQRLDHRVKGADADTELVLFQAGGDVFVGVCVDVGIHADGDVGLEPHLPRDGVDALHLGYRLAVEAADADLEREAYLGVGLGHSGKDYLGGVEARCHGQVYLAAAHAVHPEAVAAHRIDDALLVVGLDGVMYLVSVFCSLVAALAQGGAQQVHVVVIEGCFNVLENLNCLTAYHILDSKSGRI